MRLIYIYDISNLRVKTCRLLRLTLQSIVVSTGTFRFHIKNLCSIHIVKNGYFPVEHGVFGFQTEKLNVYCAVRTKSPNVTKLVFVVKGLKIKFKIMNSLEGL